MHHYRTEARGLEGGRYGLRPGQGPGRGCEAGRGYFTFTASQAVFTVLYSTEPVP